MGKKVLILGNGFDLAHGKPTRYADFLEFAKRVLTIYTFNNRGDALIEYKKQHIETWGKNEKTNPVREYLKQELINLFENRKYEEFRISGTNQYDISVNITLRVDEFYRSLKNNIWYIYISDLYKDRKMRGEDWIDFESEISYIIQILDNRHTSLSQPYVEIHNALIQENDSNEKAHIFSNICNRVCSFKNITNNNELLTLERMIDKLYDDLELLIRAFEIYLTDFVEKIDIAKTIQQIRDLSVDYVMNFNYTKTYESLYDKNIYVCHIHGICDDKRKAEENDMVIGIDEYVPVDERSRKVDFSIFKKFVQRIRNHNDVSYASWIEEIEKIGKDKNDTTSHIIGKNAVVTISNDFCSDIYVFGHSLNITDKDILKRFFVNDATRIHLFVRKKADEGKMISNLLKIMDEETVIKKSTTNPPMIEFICLNINSE